MDKKIQDYQVIAKSPKPEFEQLCRTAISEGWTPFGGISFLQIDLPKINDQKMFGFIFSQAFV